MVVPVDDTSWLDLARAAPLNRGPIEALSRRVAAAPEQAAEVDAAIDAALAGAEGEAAAALLLAAAAAGRRPDARRVLPVLPFVDDLTLEALVAAATGDRVAVLVEAAGSRRLDAPGSALALLLATALLEGAPPPPGLLVELRLLAREELDPEAGDMVATCAKTLRDPHLTAVAGRWLAELDRAGEAPFDLVALRRRVNGPPLQLLPEDDGPAVVEGDGAPLRAESKVGRNDPCPCGSGKKFKKCCEGKPAPGAAAGALAVGAPAQAPASSGPLGAAEVQALRPHELQRLEPSRLAAPEGLIEAYHACVELGLWAPAARFTEALVARAREHPEDVPDLGAEDLGDQDPGTDDDDGDDDGGDHDGGDELGADDGGPPPPDAWRMELVMAALQAGEAGVVREQVGRMEPALRDSPDARLLLAIADPGPDALARLEEAAAAALRGDAPDCTAGLVALRVLVRHPALGALLARGALDPADPEREGWLLEDVERARDRLLLPPGDPYQGVLQALLRDREARARAAAEAKAQRKQRPRRAPATDEPEADPDALRERLREAATRASELEEEVRRLRSRARDEGAAPRPRAAGPGDPAEAARLREKVDELKAVLAESQEERRALRRELEAARAREEEEARARPTAEAERRREDEDDEDEGPALEAPDERRPALVPLFSDAAAAAIRDADRALGRAALRVVSGVAGGDPQVWGQVKRLRRRADLCSARVGIHHRLLFRLQPARGELEVVSFINRRELDATIRRLG